MEYIWLFCDKEEYSDSQSIQGNLISQNYFQTSLKIIPELPVYGNNAIWITDSVILLLAILHSIFLSIFSFYTTFIFLLLFSFSMHVLDLQVNCNGIILAGGTQYQLLVPTQGF